MANITIRRHTPGDVDQVILRHKQLYESEFGFSQDTFGVYVERYAKAFEISHNPARECMLIASADGAFAGSLALVDAGENVCQLRWFLLEPSLRGQGIGHLLLQEILSFARHVGYTSAMLWTADNLPAARHLYETYGFVLTETVPNTDWGPPVNEQRWDLNPL